MIYVILTHSKWQEKFNVLTYNIHNYIKIFVILNTQQLIDNHKMLTNLWQMKHKVRIIVKNEWMVHFM